MSRSQRGISLLEVLISLVVIAVGVLGTNKLLAINQANRADALAIERATFLAQSLAEEARNNAAEQEKLLCCKKDNYKEKAGCRRTDAQGREWRFWVVPPDASSTAVLTVPVDANATDAEVHSVKLSVPFETATCTAS
ncbi:type IV pilus modification PilV family protein [Crenobacter cavernae]|uniref:Prepilin-type N-terminal cleavage/methylation domain-containing protein n=1 Tax=Crenobacter cavernae TaxID=2290923 RepID=A0A345Y474_9NEIS|nr:prepilin-type N-terminal cleavage/methylation domain-containing protein [Crenobacter cavernae]AXK38726.1 prepilin-type N-terminal cleavage/methylation domain-containing protein [Crenobacter cavernae]